MKIETLLKAVYIFLQEDEWFKSCDKVATARAVENQINCSRKTNGSDSLPS